MLFISALAIFLLAERLEVVTARPAAASSSIINTPNEAAARPENHLQLRTAGKTPEPASAPSHWTGVEAVETEELMCDLKERIETMRELQRGVLQSLAAAFSAARVRDDAASRAHVAEGRRLSLLIESSRETLVQDCCGDTRSQCAREVHAQMKAGLQKVEFGAPSNTNGRSESSLTGTTSSDRFVGSDGAVNESEEMAAEEDVLNMWADNSVANTARE